MGSHQAKKIRDSDADLAARLLHDLTVADKDSAKRDAADWADHRKKWTEDLKEGEDQARAQEEKVHEFEKKVDEAEARANRYDLAEALLEIALVITSVTLLTRSRIYWYFGFAFAAAGIVSALLASYPYAQLKNDQCEPPSPHTLSLSLSRRFRAIPGASASQSDTHMYRTLWASAMTSRRLASRRTRLRRLRCRWKALPTRR